VDRNLPEQCQTLGKALSQADFVTDLAIDP
jgi:hypothetical protein